MKLGYRIGLVGALFAGVLTSGLNAQENEGGAPRSEFSKVGAGTGSFLNLPVGARAAAMGASFVAVADDASALFWNPAGITQIEGTGASYTFAPYFAGMTHHFAGASFGISEDWSLGISALSYGSDEIEVTTMFEQEGTGATYTAQDLALGITIGGQLTEQFAFGATGKFVNLKIADVNASTVAFDFGTLYRPGILGLRIGFAVDNLAPAVTYSGTGLSNSGDIDPITGNQNPDAQVEAGEATLPLTFRAGLATDLFEGEEDQSLLVNTEFSTASDRSEYIGLGVEYVWNKLIAVRAGYHIGSEEAFGPSGGIGLNYQTDSFAGSIDYAIRPHANLGLTNHITASIRLQ
jgi:hypothetical protein